MLLYRSYIFDDDVDVDVDDVDDVEGFHAPAEAVH